MKKLLLPFALTACGPQPQKLQTAAPAPSPAAPVVAAAPAAPEACKPTVLGRRDPAEEAEYAEEEAAREKYEAENPARVTCSDETMSCIGDESGHTRDDKLAAINRIRPDEGVCDTRHRDDLADGILKHPAPKAVARRATSTRTVANMALVSNVLALTPSEQAQLARDGLVVPDRLSYDSFTTAYYDVHRGELPLYVSVDSIMHAVYASHDKLLANIESDHTMQQLDEVLGAMQCGLAAAAGDYPPEVAQDLDLYLTVARTLLANSAVPSALGKVDQRAAEIIDQIHAEAGEIEIDLFGRMRVIDTSMFTPRGHYTEFLAGYFQAAMWLSRVDLNLVSRGTRAAAPGDSPDPRETPREDVDALALADLAQRTGALDKIAALDQAWRVLAGAREDVSIAELVALRTQAGITKIDAAAADKLRTAIGDKWQRTVNTGPTPNVPDLPAIATLLGPRITPDTVATGELIAQRGQNVTPVEFADMLGFDRARKYITDTSHDAVKKRAQARATLAVAPLGDDLYGAWLGAIRTLATKPAGATPSFMDQPAFEDLRLDTALAAYGQLRHNHVLIAAQAYDQGGCEIPDGYVEPAPATYTALAAYAHKGAATFLALDPEDTSHSAVYFQRLEKLMNVLAQISREELANQPLSEDTKRFLSMIVEERTTIGASYNGTFPLATFDGWYLDLFTSIDDALADPSFIADVATYARAGAEGVHYLGAKRPRLGVFDVDTAGGPRLMVGPVARAFEYTGPLAKRATDDDVPSLAVAEPWAVSYTVTAPATPKFALAFARQGAKLRSWDVKNGTVTANTLKFASGDLRGAVTIELLDHHFTKLADVSVTLTGGTIDVALPAVPRPIEALRVRIGRYTERFDVSLTGFGSWTTSEIRAPSLDDGDDNLGPRRKRTTEVDDE